LRLRGPKKSLSQILPFLKYTHKLLPPSLIGGKWFIKKHGKVHNK